MGAVQMTIGTIASAIVGFVQKSSSMPMAAVMAICAILALILFREGRRRIATG